MDFAKRLKRDPAKAKDGVWFKFLGDVEFKIRPNVSEDYHFVRAELADRYRSQLSAGGGVAAKAGFDMACEIAARFHLTDWKNVEMDGEVLECNEDNRLSLCTEYPDVTAFITSCAGELEPYRLKEDEVTIKK